MIKFNCTAINLRSIFECRKSKMIMNKIMKRILAGPIAKHKMRKHGNAFLRAIIYMWIRKKRFRETPERQEKIQRQNILSYWFLTLDLHICYVFRSSLCIIWLGKQNFTKVNQVIFSQLYVGGILEPSQKSVKVLIFRRHCIFYYKNNLLKNYVNSNESFPVGLIQQIRCELFANRRLLTIQELVSTLNGSNNELHQK